MIGHAYGRTIMENCCNTGDITAMATSAADIGASEAIAGGMAGLIGNQALIERCYNTGNIKAVGVPTTVSDQSAAYAFVHAGGINGRSLENVTIKNSYNTGDVETTAKVISIHKNPITIEKAFSGGISGEVLLSKPAVIENCYNIGAITASAESGNGYVLTGGIIGNASYSIVEITHCYFIGGPDDAICGNLSDEETAKDIADGDQASGAKTEEQMRQTLDDILAGSTIYHVGNGGWDFENIWSIEEGKNGGYPILSPSIDPDAFIEVSEEEKELPVEVPEGEDGSEQEPKGEEELPAEVSEGEEGQEPGPDQEPAESSGGRHRDITLVIAAATLFGLLAVLYGYKVR